MNKICYICEKTGKEFIEIPGPRYYSIEETKFCCAECASTTTKTPYLHVKDTDKTGAGPFWEPWYVQEYNEGIGNIKISYHGGDEYGRVVQMIGPSKLKHH